MFIILFVCYHINPSGNDVCSWVKHLVQDYIDSEHATLRDTCWVEGRKHPSHTHVICAYDSEDVLLLVVDDVDDVVVVVVAVSAVLRMHDSRATTFGSRRFNKAVIFRFVSDFLGLF